MSALDLSEREQRVWDACYGATFGLMQRSYIQTFGDKQTDIWATSASSYARVRANEAVTELRRHEAKQARLAQKA